MWSVQAPQAGSNPEGDCSMQSCSGWWGVVLSLASVPSVISGLHCCCASGQRKAADVPDSMELGFD